MLDSASAAAIHTTGVKVNISRTMTPQSSCQDCIDNYENVLIFQLLEAQVDTGREEPYHQVEVEEECRPCSRLMFRDRRDNRNVNLGISGIPQRVEATTPGSNDARNGQ